jgi:hypothetical protein
LGKNAKYAIERNVRRQKIKRQSEIRIRQPAQMAAAGNNEPGQDAPAILNCLL